MTQVSPNNSTVKHVITSGDSVTVPAGETWVVDMHFNFEAGSTRGEVDINGVSFSWNQQDTQQQSKEMVFTDGDTIDGPSSRCRVVLSGYVV